MICKSCFGIMPKDAAFCPKCGVRTNGETQPQVQDVFQPPQQDAYQPQDTYQPQDEFQPHLPPPVHSTAEQPASGMATAALVMGILSLTMLGPLGGILGLIFALSARSQGNRSGQATAGLVMSIISLALTVLVIGCIVCVVALDPVF